MNIDNDPHIGSELAGEMLKHLCRDGLRVSGKPGCIHGDSRASPTRSRFDRAMVCAGFYFLESASMQFWQWSPSASTSLGMIGWLMPEDWSCWAVSFAASGKVSASC